jgi:hypothetical protein
VTRRFQQCSREHAGEFRRGIGRDIESFARDGSLALFGAIFPTRLAVFKFKSFLDRRFPIIVALTFIFGRDPAASSFQLAVM